MERRPLGQSGLSVSAVALGTWAMGCDSRAWGPVDDRESIATIHQALDCGINLIDTAPIYGLGHSEEIVGKALQGRRASALIATKCGLAFPTAPDKPPRRCLTREHVIEECRQSLRRLATDVIDIYQCHWPDPETPIQETMEALATLLKEGKIRSIGVSNFGCERLAAAREFGSINSAQPLLSMLQRRAAEDLIPYCVECHIGVIAYGPIARGLLTGKFSAKSKFSDLRSRDAEFTGDRYQRNLRVVDELRAIARKYDKTVGQLAINWAAGRPGVTVSLVGAKRPSQILENAGGVGWDITDEDKQRIEAILES